MNIPITSDEERVTVEKESVKQPAITTEDEYTMEEDAESDKEEAKKGGGLDEARVLDSATESDTNNIKNVHMFQSDSESRTKDD